QSFDGVLDRLPADDQCRMHLCAHRARRIDIGDHDAKGDAEEKSNANQAAQAKPQRHWATPGSMPSNRRMPRRAAYAYPLRPPHQTKSKEAFVPGGQNSRVDRESATAPDEA